HDRAVDLLERKVGTTKTRDEAFSQMRVDQAELELARARLDKSTISAPFDGVVGLRKVSVGDFVDAGDEIVNVEQIDPLKADFRVAESYLGAVRPGQRIELGVDAFPGQAFTGEVYAIDPLIDEAGRSILLRAKLPNPDHVLRPGLFARVTLVLNEREDAIQVPEQALVPQGQDQFVFKVEDGKAAFAKVTTGRSTCWSARSAPPRRVTRRSPRCASTRRSSTIRRPVLATVMSLIVVLVGIIAYDRLTVREYPKIDEPVVTVETTFKGASADIVESQVTQILEESLAGIEGIDYMSSISRPERSQITARFRLDREPDAAANDVRDRAARVRGRLPDEIEEPIVSKVEADAQPILYLAFSSDRHSPMDVTDFADRFVKDRLQNLAGVADVRIFGERRYSMRIWLDRARLAAYRLTPADVEEALRRQNVEIPAGRIESQAREFTVVTETDLRTPAQFENVVLREESAYPIRLGDVGRAEFGPENERVNVRFNGRSAVALGVVKQATANPLDVSQAVRAELPAIQQDLPEGMQTDLAYDSSIFIRESIDAVFTTIAEAVVLVVLVIFFFLRSFRATLIPLVTIPVSLVGAFALMLAFGFSINTLTLLAMVLAVGLVVDDAIVMLENIHRHVEEGMAPFQAALAGAREIGFAVLAMTVTLASVYAPIGFMTGRTGKLFTEFALALAGAVLVSGFVALSLSPMMCSKMLRHVERHGLLYRVIENGIVLLTRGYRRALAATLAPATSSSARSSPSSRRSRTAARSSRSA
ncbi:MAG: hydrophobic/amphiphilic exporter, partial [Geminicoccaceae bacterium]|nr:hydrophobic/amphiphilic exporter [Geminicoccaceae bacterium]